MTGFSPQETAERVVAGMLATDTFSRWLDLEVLEVAPRRSVCRMRVRHDMMNGFGVAHGGIVFSLADSAFAFACNSDGRVTVSIENSITYPAPIHEGDVLTATAEEQTATNRLSWYLVEVRNQQGILVSAFRGTAYRTNRPHPSLTL